jgi:hypothetical protein
MRLLSALIFLASLAGGNFAPSGFSAITYVDATTNNTTLQGGAPLTIGANYTSSSTSGAMDNLWHLLTDVGNGNGVWTADELTSGSEDVTPLVTTINLPEAGGYRVFAYIWTSTDPGEDWDARLRLGSVGVFHKIQGSEAEAANPARFTNAVVTSESPRQLIQIPIGVVLITNGGTVQVFVDDDTTIGSRRTWYDGVGFERIFNGLGERLAAIDFNKTNTPGAPVQAMFRSLFGSGTTSQNSTSITKAVGSAIVRLSKTSATAFDFRGANGDSTRVIPGGPTSLSSLVADFIGTRDGTINLSISNLAAGTYFFRSYHLDTFTNANLGYAQGSNSTTANVVRAHVGGTLEAIVQPTALSPAGLGTNFISDSDIPTLAFPVVADGTNASVVNLSTVYTNGVDRFILLNGFELYSTSP